MRRSTDGFRLQIARRLLHRFIEAPVSTATIQLNGEELISPSALSQAVRYEERGPAVSAEAKKVRARKMIRELRSLGYRVEPLPTPSSNPA